MAGKVPMVLVCVFPVWLQPPRAGGGGGGVLQRLLQTGGRETLHVSQNILRNVSVCFSEYSLSFNV